MKDSNKNQTLKNREIEEIFSSKFESLSRSDRKWINNNLSTTPQILKKNSRERFKVKGKVVCIKTGSKKELAIEKWPQDKKEIAYHLALILEDRENLAWYLKLARERRGDFLRNCLQKTLYAYQEGVIKKTRAAYFAGVVRNRTEELKRLEEYKQKHTTLYG